jgi:hypothetical protein
MRLSLEILWQLDGHESFINDRLLSVVNYAVNINTLENEKEYKQAFKSLFRKSADDS